MFLDIDTCKVKALDRALTLHENNPKGLPYKIAQFRFKLFLSDPNFPFHVVVSSMRSKYLQIIHFGTSGRSTFLM